MQRSIILGVGICAVASIHAQAQFAGMRVDDATALFEPGSTHFGANQANVQQAWTEMQADYGAHSVYRIYADFFSPGNFVDSVFSFDQILPMSIAINQPAYNFSVTSGPTSGLTAPFETWLEDPFIARSAFDTFATIGIDVRAIGAPGTIYIGGFTAPPSLRGLFKPSDFAGFEFPADPGLYTGFDGEMWRTSPAAADNGVGIPNAVLGTYEVLLAQITVPVGTTIDGYFSGFWGADFFNRGDEEPELLTFASSFFIPSPGTLAITGFALAACARRRRS